MHETPPPARYTLASLRAAVRDGRPQAMLTCYDFLTAGLMRRAGVPMLLVGDSASNVIFGHETTVPVSLEQMIDLTAAVKRGAPQCLVIADMPFGSVHGGVSHAMTSIVRMCKRSACDMVKIEVGPRSEGLVSHAAEAGVAVMAHLGLKPQSIGRLGSYKAAGRTAEEADAIVSLAERMEAAGAEALLLEAVPPEVSREVVKRVKVPVIGCGAGPACHGHVVVWQDLCGLTDKTPRFVPKLPASADKASPATPGAALEAAFAAWVKMVAERTYPQPEHEYAMQDEQLSAFEHLEAQREPRF